MTETESASESRPPSTVNDPEADPDAPAGGGGPGRFRTRKSPITAGFINVKADVCSQSPSASDLDPRYCEEVKPGTKEEITDTDQNIHIIVERQKDGLYHWLIETLDGNTSCEGVYDPEIDFTAEHCMDRTSKKALRALEKEVEVTTKKPPGPAKREIIYIVKEDWLSKISQARWGTFEWERHLKVTQETLDNRKQRGELFDEDLIYPGDTFEVVSNSSR